MTTRVTDPTRPRAAARLPIVALAVVVGLGNSWAAAPPASASTTTTPPSAPPHAGIWRIWPLPTIPDAFPSGAAFIDGTDGSRTFAGSCGDRAALWRDGKVINLGVSGTALDVNRHGDAVGFQIDDQMSMRAALWHEGVTTWFAGPPGMGASHATGVNDAGLVVGWAQVPDPARAGGSVHAMVWSTASPSAFQDLGTLDENPTETAFLTGVSEDGTLVGYTVNQDTFVERAVIGTARTGLHELFGTVPGFSVQALGIAGRFIVGAQILPNGTVQGLLWENRRPRALPTPPGASGAEAHDVNSHGTALGSSWVDALVWPLGATHPIVLPKLPGTDRTVPSAITEDDVIGGIASTPDMFTVPVTWSRR
ncbi:MAG: hypothetical protein QG608_607 [Actinomycetota bacterium]|nr:hypothetical protein [Actinomycetota bacterium]